MVLGVNLEATIILLGSLFYYTDCIPYYVQDISY